jgi:hypothetical protein
MTLPDRSSSRDLLRHTVATLAYRGGKAVRNAPAGFSDFRIGPDSRTPGQILAHIGDLLDWALWLVKGEHKWKTTSSKTWAADVKRFHAALAKLDRFLASSKPLGFPAGQIFQGPVADALTHVGQIAMLRRLADAPIKAENYFSAKITVGRVGADQPSPVREF